MKTRRSGGREFRKAKSPNSIDVDRIFEGYIGMSTGANEHFDSSTIIDMDSAKIIDVVNNFDVLKEKTDLKGIYVCHENPPNFTDKILIAIILGFKIVNLDYLIESMKFNSFLIPVKSQMITTIKFKGEMFDISSIRSNYLKNGVILLKTVKIASDEPLRTGTEILLELYGHNTTQATTTLIISKTESKNNITLETLMLSFIKSKLEIDLNTSNRKRNFPSNPIQPKKMNKVDDDDDDILGVDLGLGKVTNSKDDSETDTLNILNTLIKEKKARDEKKISDQTFNEKLSLLDEISTNEFEEQESNEIIIPPKHIFVMFTKVVKLLTIEP